MGIRPLLATRVIVVRARLQEKARLEGDPRVIHGLERETRSSSMGRVFGFSTVLLLQNSIA
jgi:hypothetical protein